jgi:molybdenum cofactor cytidylyltransferase
MPGGASRAGRKSVSERLTGIVLAAGASTRMGRPKQLLDLGGRPLLQHVIDAALASCLVEIVLVLGHGADEVRAALDLPASPRCRVVVNPAHREGPASSLRAGLAAADPASRAAAILLGDQPFVSAARIDRVARAFLEAGLPAARPIDRGSSGEPVPGHPVFLARSIWPALAEISGDEGARALFAAHPDWVHAVDLGDAPLLDVDREADLARARQVLVDS